MQPKVRTRAQSGSESDRPTKKRKGEPRGGVPVGFGIRPVRFEIPVKVGTGGSSRGRPRAGRSKSKSRSDSQLLPGARPTARQGSPRGGRGRTGASRSNSERVLPSPFVFATRARIGARGSPARVTTPGRKKSAPPRTTPSRAPPVFRRGLPPAPGTDKKPQHPGFPCGPPPWY